MAKKTNKLCISCAQIKDEEWKVIERPACYHGKACSRMRYYYRHHELHKALQLEAHRYNRFREDHCAICKAENNLHTHHVKPQALGGADSARNALTLCEKCHSVITKYYAAIGLTTDKKRRKEIRKPVDSFEEALLNYPLE